jgi:intracellular sulfur oxidation DsrE/DsrF family protein
MFKRTITVVALGLCWLGHAWAESPLDKAHMGPVIESFGPVLDVPNASFELKKGVHYKAIMDLSEIPETDGELNSGLVSVARYLNMNVGSGIKAEDLEFAVVVHGKAVQDMLSDEASNKHFERPNANTALLKELKEAGVKVYVCGQSAAFRGFTLEEMNPIVSMAISAMSAHVRLQSEGYSLIPF